MSDTVDQFSSRLKCTRHEKEPIVSFCIPCKEVFCFKCHISRHEKEHLAEGVSIKDFLFEIHKNMDRGVDDLKQTTVNLLRKQEEKINKLIEKCKEEGENLKQMTRKTIYQLERAVPSSLQASYFGMLDKKEGISGHFSNFIISLFEKYSIVVPKSSGEVFSSEENSLKNSKDNSLSLLTIKNKNNNNNNNNNGRMIEETEKRDDSNNIFRLHNKDFDTIQDRINNCFNKFEININEFLLVLNKKLSDPLEKFLMENGLSKTDKNDGPLTKDLIINEHPHQNNNEIPDENNLNHLVKLSSNFVFKESKGVESFRNRRYGEAYQHLLEEIKQITNQEEIEYFDKIMILGKTCEKLRKLDEAFDFYEKAIKIKKFQKGEKDIESLQLQVKKLNLMRKIYPVNERKNFINAEQLYKQIKKYKLKGQKDTLQVAEANLSLGKLLSHLEKSAQARKLHQKATDILQEEKLNNIELYGECLTWLGIDNYDLMKYDEAIKYLRLANDVFDSIDINIEKIEYFKGIVLYWLGIAYAEKNNSADSFESFKKSLFYLEPAKNKKRKLVAETYYEIGAYYFKRGEFEECLKYNLLAEKEYSLFSTEKNFELFYVYKEIGSVLVTLNRYRKAFKYFKKCVRLNEICDNSNISKEDVNFCKLHLASSIKTKIEDKYRDLIIKHLKDAKEFYNENKEIENRARYLREIAKLEKF